MNSVPIWLGGRSPLSLASTSVTAVLASTFASPTAPAPRVVPLRSISVSPPPTWYPTAVMDLAVTSDAGVCGAWARALELTRDHTTAAESTVLAIAFIAYLETGRDRPQPIETPSHARFPGQKSTGR